MWNWGSPVAWAVFLVGAGIAVLMLSIGFEYFSKAVANFVALPAVNKKRR